MLLKAEILSTLFVQIVAFFSLLFIQYNPFLKELTPFLSTLSIQQNAPSKLLLRESTEVSLDIWSRTKEKRRHTHLYSPKQTLFAKKGGKISFFGDFSDVELFYDEGLGYDPLKKLCSLSSHYGLLDIEQKNLTLSNASILFEEMEYNSSFLSGNGFADSVIISSFSSSPSIRMEGFSAHLNTSSEAL